MPAEPGIKLTGAQSCLAGTTQETTVADDQALLSRRKAMKCMAFGGAGTLFALAGGVFTPIDLALKTSVRPDQRYAHRLQQRSESRCEWNPHADN
jgi:hypothetical protein